MVQPLDEQIADLEALQRELDVLTAELDATRLPTLVERMQPVCREIRAALPLVAVISALVVCVLAGYWLVTHLSPPTWEVVDRALNTPAPASSPPPARPSIEDQASDMTEALVHLASVLGLVIMGVIGLGYIFGRMG